MTQHDYDQQTKGMEAAAFKLYALNELSAFRILIAEVKKRKSEIHAVNKEKTA